MNRSGYAVVGPDGVRDVALKKNLLKPLRNSLNPNPKKPIYTIQPVNIATECRWERSDLFGGGDEYRTGCATDTTRFALPEFCPDCGGPVVVIEGAW